MARTGMTREEAGKLYDSLKTAMENKYGKKGLQELIAKEQQSKSQSSAKSPYKRAQGTGSTVASQRTAAQRTMPTGRMLQMPTSPNLAKHASSGQRTALMAVVAVGVLKLLLGAVAASGLMQGGNVEATIIPTPVINVPQFSDDELIILKSLDERRVVLEERNKKLDKREEELTKRDRELAAHLTQLRELTTQLKLERDKGEKKRTGQLNQLASVYSSMSPKDAAQLLEQLDISISLSLIERMPEKRMAQVLALMTPAKALTLTQMLSKSKL